MAITRKNSKSNKRMSKNTKKTSKRSNSSKRNGSKNSKVRKPRKSVKGVKKMKGGDEQNIVFVEIPNILYFLNNKNKKITADIYILLRKQLCSFSLIQSLSLIVKAYLANTFINTKYNLIGNNELKSINDKVTTNMYYMLYLVKKQPESNKTNNNNDNDKYEFQYPYKKNTNQNIIINGMPTFIDFENYQDILEMEDSITNKDNSNHFSISKPYVDKIMDKYEATKTQTQTQTPTPAPEPAQTPTPTSAPTPTPTPTPAPTPTSEASSEASASGYWESHF